MALDSKALGPPGSAPPWQSRLWKKYVGALVGLSLFFVAAFGASDWWANYNAALKQAGQLQLARAREAEHALRISMQAIDRSIQAVQALPLQSAWLGPGVRREEYGRLLRLVAPIDELVYEPPAGQAPLRVSRRDADAVPQQQMPGTQPQPATGPPYEVRYSENLLPTAVLVYPDREGSGAGRTLVGVSLLAWSRELRGSLTAPGMEIYAIDGKGRVALHREPSVLMSRRQLPPQDLTRLLAGRDAAPGPMSFANPNGPTLVRTVLPVDSLGWSVVVEQSQADVMAPVWSALWRTAAFIMLGVALAVAAGAWLAGRMTRPMRQLHLAAATMAAGDMSVRVNIQTRDELEDLAQQFNHMAASLQASVNELEDRVAQRTIELTEANRHKDEFLAGMSHELRTPLNGILGFADVLREGMAGPLNPEQHEYLEDIHRSGLMLLSLINDLLDQARLASGKLTLDLADFDMAETLDMAAAVMRRDIENKQQTLQVDVQPGMPPWHADARRIKQVVLNLLGNAVKFTPNGGHVDLRAGLNADGSRWLEVQDTGPGIAPEHHELIFVWGGQAPEVELNTPLSSPHTPPAPRRRSTGLGLGLALVRGMVRAHGGDVTLRSELGQGATFRVTLPPVPSPTGSPPASPAYGPDDQRTHPT